MIASRHSRKQDITEDLKKFDVPTLIILGDDDQVVRSAHRRCSQQGL